MNLHCIWHCFVGDSSCLATALCSDHGSDSFWTWVHTLCHRLFRHGAFSLLPGVLFCGKHWLNCWALPQAEAGASPYCNYDKWLNWLTYDSHQSHASSSAEATVWTPSLLPLLTQDVLATSRESRLQYFCTNANSICSLFDPYNSLNAIITTMHLVEHPVTFKRHSWWSSKWSILSVLKS